MKVLTFIATLSCKFIANKIQNVPNYPYDCLEFSDFFFFFTLFSGLHKKKFQNSSLVLFIKLMIKGAGHLK